MVAPPSETYLQSEGEVVVASGSSGIVVLGNVVIGKVRRWLVGLYINGPFDAEHSPGNFGSRASFGRRTPKRALVV